MDRRAEVRARLEADFDRNLEIVRAFVRQPSISADGTGIREMAEIIKGKIQELGGEAAVVPTSGWPVVWGEINAGAPKTLLLYGMYDVQPVAGEEWITPPFAAEIVDLPRHGPSLVNRGIFNSKGPLVQFLNVLAAIKAVEGRLPLNVKFMIEGEEELGSKHLPEFVDAYKEGLTADAAFFGFYSQDATGKPLMYLGVKGILFMEWISRGGDWGGPTTSQIHGSNAVWMHNPAWRLVHALAACLSEDQKHILVDGFYDDIQSPSQHDEALLARIPETFNAEEQLTAHEVRRFKYDLQGVDLLRKYLYQPTLNIDGIVGGHILEGTKTIIPHEARAKVDVRMVPTMRPESTVRRIREYLDRRGFDTIEIEVLDAYPPAKLRVDSAPTQALIKSYETLGYRPEIWPHLAGSAPFYLFTEVLNIPAALGGLGHGGRPHRPNEYATLAGMRLYEQSVVEFLYNLTAA